MPLEFRIELLFPLAATIVTALTAIGGIWSLRNIAAKRQKFDEKLAGDKFEYDKKLNDRKRRQEIAEEVLSGVYELRAIIKHARFPGSFSSEGAERPRSPDEPQNIASTRDSYFVPIARLNQSGERINNILSKRFRAAALLGSEVADQLENLRIMLNEIRIAAQMLIQSAGEHTDRMPQAIHERYINKIWSMSADPDPIEARLDEIVSRTEAICRPILSE
ncbi:MAG: hypothetical protein ING69_10700 [Rhodocyclaceae bacterium]|nr:hypothetical protein [Rhodocyclaceae bacterium]